MSYLIIPDEDADLLIDVQSLRNQLKSSWSNIVFQEVMIPSYMALLTWTITFGDDELLGDLHDDKRTVSLDSSAEGIAVFAAWYREFIPAKYQLYLCHDQTIGVVELLIGHTKELILAEMLKL